MTRATFANPQRHVQSWYVAGLSSELRRGRALSRTLLGRRIALYRGEDGAVRALDARCAHLGADLGQGRVVGNDLRCGFHHWTYGGDGRCIRIPSLQGVPAWARTFAYPVEERWGVVWLFNGRVPLFPLPSFESRSGERLVATRLKPRLLPCHPHLAVANGLDIEHFKTVHGFDFVREPNVAPLDAYRTRAVLDVRLRRDSAGARCLAALTGGRFLAAFTTWGGNLATIEGRAGPVEVLVLFTHRPLEQGGSASQTFLFSVAGRSAALAKMKLALAGLVMAHILTRDREVLDTLAFRPNLVAADAPLAAFMRQVNAMPVNDAPRCEDAREPSRPASSLG
jgi:phenylpropionate dioxygenase-like ring-hydroxylating dioxygenase large terminal subunit